MQAPDPDKLAAVLRELAAVKQSHTRLLGLVAQLTGSTTDLTGCRLVREGEYWTIANAGAVTRVRDCKGLGYLARLVAQPHVEIHAVDLVGAPNETDAPALDARAKAAYRAALAAGHPDRDAISRELARGVGLHGRDRASGACERARINATRTIKDAIGKIARGDRELGRHLTASVRTGAFCCYDPHVPRAWAT